MYKAVVNNQIVNMRKEVKKSQRHVIQVFHKKIKINHDNLDKAKQKENEKLMKKFASRDEKLNEELKIAKEVKADDVSKLALISKDLNLDKISDKDEKVKMMIASHNYVQKMVQKFRDENKDWESWIEPVIDLWKEKKEIRSGANKSKIKKDSASDNKSSVTEKKKKVEMKNLELKPKETLKMLKPKDVSNDKKKIVSSKDGSDDEDDNQDDDDNDVNEDEECEESEEEDADEAKEEEEVDDFFVGSVIKHKVVKKRKLTDAEDGDADNEDVIMNNNHSFGNKFGKRLKDDPNSVPIRNPRLKTMDANLNNNYSSDRRQPFTSGQLNKRKVFDDDGNTSHAPAIKGPSVHPSWQAKQKEKLLIASALSAKSSSAKHIKFDD